MTADGAKTVCVAARSERRDDIENVFMAFYICALILMAFVTISDRFLHWFVLPVLLCGALAGRDALDWVRRRSSVLDPVGCLGVLGLHLFFLAPLLHVLWDTWMPYITPPPDWRPWLGGMAILNCLGLLVYHRSRGAPGLPKTVPKRPVWRLVPVRFIAIIGTALLMGGVLQVWVYQQYGGILGYISTYMAAHQMGPGDNPFKGMGALFIVSESFPILAMMAFAVYASRRKRARSWGVLVAAFLVYFGLLMLFGGLRGSRSNTLYNLFWGAGMVHVLVRPLSKGVIVLGLMLVIGFMYLYGFYKEAGLEALTALETRTEQVLEMESRTGRTFQGMLLGDLGRSDVQAFLLYRLWSFPTYYEYAWGRTYLGTATLLIPSRMWPEREPTKVKEGTEAMFGKGAHRPGVWEASNVYGLAGETMLNFGPFAVPIAFLLLGWAVKKIRLICAALDEQDLRQLMVPFGVILAANLLTGDSDNLLWLIVKFGMVPFLVIAAGCHVARTRVPR